MSRTRYRFSSELQPFFVTQTVVSWLPVLAYPEHAEIVLESWRFLQRERGIVILAWVIMENHLHWIAVGPELGKRVGEFKSFTALKILRHMESRGFKTWLRELEFFKARYKRDQVHQFWQEGR
jgi:putative transposase